MNKWLTLLATALHLLLFTGCADDSIPAYDESFNNDDPEPSSAVVEAEQQVKEQVALMIVEEAVQGFRVFNEERRYPHDLNEVVEQGMMLSLPDLPPERRFTYNSDSGEVRIVDGVESDEEIEARKEAEAAAEVEPADEIESVEGLDTLDDIDALEGLEPAEEENDSWENY